MPKTCTRCKVTYDDPTAAFYRRRSARDGLTYTCRTCCYERAMARYANLKATSPQTLERYWARSNRNRRGRKLIDTCRRKL